MISRHLNTVEETKLFLRQGRTIEDENKSNDRCSMQERSLRVKIFQSNVNGSSSEGLIGIIQLQLAQSTKFISIGRCAYMNMDKKMSCNTFEANHFYPRTQQAHIF
ncbi:hypothetical protein RF11_14281 [Thelohanellus kitauei]|uniref:Uncharacterized protein n=1 Tax=Thelohanellus kitauei TaxID=669202 RepID=A0A0C2M4J8_THEKT|nr:hypothetical protein RF11_14281 [Thelohanellus kitauei]